MRDSLENVVFDELGTSSKVVIGILAIFAVIGAVLGLVGIILATNNSKSSNGGENDNGGGGDTNGGDTDNGSPDIEIFPWSVTFSGPFSEETSVITLVKNGPTVTAYIPRLMKEATTSATILIEGLNAADPIPPAIYLPKQSLDGNIMFVVPVLYENGVTAHGYLQMLPDKWAVFKNTGSTPNRIQGWGPADGVCGIENSYITYNVE